MAGEVVGDDHDLAVRVGVFGLLQELLAVLVVAGRGAQGDRLPSATRSPPQAQVFSGPREYSSGALTRCPPGDQPGAGGKVRGITGPSSSAQITVEPGGGAV
jgi:hypothetical protein